MPVFSSAARYATLVLGLVLWAGCDSVGEPVIITYSAFGEEVESITRIEYRDVNGRLVREATPRLPFSIILNIGTPTEGQEAEISVTAIVAPGGRLSTGIISSRGADIMSETDTVEQEGQIASSLTATTRISLN